jgi:ribonuclease HII
MTAKKALKINLSGINIPHLDFENKFWQKGCQYVVGLDEVGRGAFAGPVVAGAVIFPKDVNLPNDLNDSKMLKPNIRKKIANQIKKIALFWAVAEIEVSKINKLGIGKATFMAFRKAVKQLKVRPDSYLVDAFYIPGLSVKKQLAIVGGDKICASIAAASIVAKVHRDNLMKKLHYQYPVYGFGKHKGYGTKYHQLAIAKYGQTSLHRSAFIHFV